MNADRLSVAQSLLDEAMEAWGTQEGLDKLQESLQTDPENPDALGVVASITEDPDLARQMLEIAVTSAESRLGEGYEENYAGRFWLAEETRSYMRALAVLASFEEATEHREEAIELFERLIELNPNDNQGVRYQLLGLLLAEGDLSKAGKLIETYEQDSSGWFKWGSTLYWHTMNDLAKAQESLRAAVATNSFVGAFLTGEKDLPEELPDEYDEGTEEEAIFIAIDLMEGWDGDETACDWLEEQLAAG